MVDMKGQIVSLQETWGSGIAELTIKDENGHIDVIPCENAQTVRAFESAFGNVISDSHTINPKGNHIGQWIFYSIDAFGLFEGFTPENEVD